MKYDDALSLPLRKFFEEHKSCENCSFTEISAYIEKITNDDRDKLLLFQADFTMYFDTEKYKIEISPEVVVQKLKELEPKDCEDVEIPTMQVESPDVLPELWRKFEISKGEHTFIDLYRLLPDEFESLVGLHMIELVLNDKINQADKSICVCSKCKKRQRYSELSLDEVLKLGLYDFFDYCRYGNNVCDLYILRYVEKHSDGFKLELVRSIYADFWPWFESEKEAFCGDIDLVYHVVNRYKENGVEVPVISETEFTPPRKLDCQSDKQYQNLVSMAKKAHDDSIGQIDVKKLLSVDALELSYLFKIDRILKEKMNITSVEDESAPTGKQTSDKSCPISRDAIGYLFRELRNRGVIKSISDTDLSKSAEYLTGYSAEKIRQNNPMSDRARAELKDFLISITNGM